jgi:hypothetical protein
MEVTMKNLLVAAIVSATVVFSPVSMANDGDKLLGAIAGGVLGSTVGKGDGRKAATVVGAVLGYRYGERILNSDSNRQYRNESYVPPYIPREHYSSQNYARSDREKRIYCQNNIPHRYSYNDRLRNVWVNGCLERLQQEEDRLAQEAYQDGYSLER